MMISARRPSDGFTLVELMVVVVIIGILSAIATPLLTRDKAADLGVSFANDLARELQKCRTQAATDRLPMRAFFYPNHVDLKAFHFTAASDSNVNMAGPEAGYAAFATSHKATVSDPPLRRIDAPIGVTIWAVNRSTTAPTSASLSNPVCIDFTDIATTKLVTDCDAAVSTATGDTKVWIDNTSVFSSHPFRHHKVLVSPTTARVKVAAPW